MAATQGDRLVAFALTNQDRMRAAMPLWGECYGLGLGAGLGLAFYYCQSQARALLQRRVNGIRPTLEIVNPSEHEKRQRLEDVGERLRASVTGHLAVICGFIEHEVGDFVGSGSVISIGGRPFLLTSRHVVREANSKGFKGVTYSEGDGTAYVRLHSKFRTDRRLDLALAPVALSSDGDRLPCPEQLLATSSSDVDQELLFFTGVPGARSRHSAIARTVYSRTHPYLTRSATLPPHLDARTFFAVSYDPTNLRHADGTEAEYLDRHGISGSALWNTRRVAVGPAWSPSDARLVGVIIGSDHDFRCLVAVRIEEVRQFISDALSPRRNRRSSAPA